MKPTMIAVFLAFAGLASASCNVGYDVNSVSADKFGDAGDDLSTTDTANSCPAGEDRCPNGCRDLNSDSSNCGTCGKNCPGDQVCSAGKCEQNCAAGLSECGGGCVDLTNDVDHCGSCTNSCGGDEVCADRECVCSGDCADVGKDGLTVGGPCPNDDACSADSECLSGPKLPGGTCSIACQAEADCPDGSACASASSGKYCLLTCSNDQDCRDNYRCIRQGGGGGPKVCTAR